MESLTLKILASDFEDSYYTNVDDCVLTRSYRRAGKNWKDEGIDIYNEDIDKSFSPVNYKELSQIIRRMYDSSMRLVFHQMENCSDYPIPAKDFEFILNY